MFINDVNKKEEIKNIAIKDLRELGIKYRPKKLRNTQDERIGRRVFRTVLHLLPMQTVTLPTGQQLIVPKLVDDLCSYVLGKVTTEGLFRKGGSKARQNEIKLLLDSGTYLGLDHHEIDVANVLKTFFRELPEPLFPYSYHELFLHCALSSQQREAVLLSCLLLPTEHLNTLAYFMQFLNQVAAHSTLNKMDAYNLAIVIGPTLFPIEEKVVAFTSTQQRLTKFCDLCKLLIENASNIGFISDRIIDQIAPLSLSVDSLPSDEISSKKKKKRRSGSLTRMFNGLKKIVSSKSIDVSTKSLESLQTPTIKKVDRKRRLDVQGFSNKKKHILLQNLPQRTALSTPISVHPNPKKNSSPPKSTKQNTCNEKRLQWSLGKQNKRCVDITTSLERRWSAVSQATSGFKRNKIRNSCIVSSSSSSCIQSNNEPNPDYVKISRLEYEDIQNRVSAIERRISLELDNAESINRVETVQTAYENTLVNAESLSPTTDHLAKRLSKELKIRRSIEQKVVRSPSARKIGSLRRRSRELERQSNRVCRNPSLQFHPGSVVNVRSGQANTLSTGLPSPSSNKDHSKLKLMNFSEPQLVIVHADTINVAIPTTCNSVNTSNNNVESVKWDDSHTPENSDNLLQYRSSIVRLRNRNAGVVMAKARLFDQLIDSDNSNYSNSSASNAGTKIGATRNVSQKMRSIKYDDRRAGKQSISPRKKYVKNIAFLSDSEEKENKLNVFNSVDAITLSNSSDKSHVLKDCNRLVSPNYVNFKTMPQIRRSLSMKSTRRTCRTPVSNDSRQTPVKVLSSQRVQ